MNVDVSKIEAKLAEKNMTKATLAARSGISRQSVSTILGRGSCEPRTAGRLAAGLGVQVADILKTA